jgi:biotin carboxyl carrier protein
MMLTGKSQQSKQEPMIHRFAVEVRGQDREVSVEVLEAGRYRVTVGGATRIVDARKVVGGARAATWSLLPEGGGPAALVDVDGVAPDLTVTVGGVSLPLKLVDPRRRLAATATRRAQTGPLSIKSPMPGKVVKVLVRAGDEVKAGQGLIVVEAMKMENELRAPRDGRVQAVSAQEGTAVESSQTLATLE